MKKLVLIILTVSIALFSCENSENGEAEKQLTMTADSLLKELMNAHDEVMPQTMVLENLKKKMQSRIDTLELDSAMKMDLQNTIATMDSAISGMRVWMSDFERPADTTGMESVVDYYRSEIGKMTRVKDLTFEILPEARERLSELDSL